MSDKNVTVNRNLRVNYSDVERLALGRQLADTHQNLEQAQSDLKSVKADFQARIKSHEAKIVDLAGKVSNGYQVKEVLCEWITNCPKEGVKQLVRLDTKEIVEVADMTSADKQAELPLADPNKDHLTGDVMAEKLDEAGVRPTKPVDPETGCVVVGADEDKDEE